MAGLMSITGEPGHGPMRVGIPIVDLCAGIFAAQGALMALLQRERTGTGQYQPKRGKRKQKGSKENKRGQVLHCHMGE